MDADRFADVLRSLTRAPSRRGVSRTLLGLAFVSLATRLEIPSAQGKRKKRKKKKVTSPQPTCVSDCTGKSCGDDGCGNSCGSCGACQDCQNFVCVSKPDDTTCNGSGKCLSGTCNALPTCVRVQNLCNSNPASCCGAACSGGSGTGQLCGPSGFNDPCVDNSDCSSNDCVGFRCRKGGPGAGCLANEDCLSNSCNLALTQCI